MHAAREILTKIRDLLSMRLEEVGLEVTEAEIWADLTHGREPTRSVAESQS